MKIDKTKLLPDRGYNLGDIDAVDEAVRDVAKQYKKNIAKNFISINPRQIEDKVMGKEFYLTRKYDGEFNILLFDGEESYIMNPGGKVRSELPFLDEATRLLKAANVKSGIFACEVCMKEDEGRARVFNVLQSWAEPEMQPGLRLIPFDIIEINGEKMYYNSYDVLYKELSRLFAGSSVVFPPLYKMVNSRKNIKELYDEWVEAENAEGIIIRSEYPFVYKLKPRHSADVVVVGYSEGIEDAKGQIRSMLLAMMPEDGKYQIIGKTGNGFSDEMRKEILEQLKPMEMPSQYIETDSNHVAFHMVRPEIILEVNFNDVIVENSTSVITNPILEIVDGKYKLSSITAGFSMIFPIFERFRDDKSVNTTDLRLSQITDFVYISPYEDSDDEAGTSEVLKREVYKKESKGKLMVQKFMYWKTNKEKSSKYPAFVFCYTNYSSDRKDPLNRDVKISNSEEQIKKIFDSYIEENIKKGWEKV
jgi:ATP-dependent DNA ligase